MLEVWQMLDPRIRTRACVGYKKDGFLVTMGLPEHGGMTINNLKMFFTLSTGRSHIPSFWPDTLTHQSWVTNLLVTVSRAIPWDIAAPKAVPHISLQVRLFSRPC